MPSSRDGRAARRVCPGSAETGAPQAGSAETGAPRAGRPLATDSSLRGPRAPPAPRPSAPRGTCPPPLMPAPPCRLQFCDAATQRRWFAAQLRELAAATRLPLFLHLRAAADDFLEIVTQHQGAPPPRRSSGERRRQRGRVPPAPLQRRLPLGGPLAALRVAGAASEGQGLPCTSALSLAPELPLFV